jgi:two-component system, OmpR family, sensor histidine kinase SenX3
MNGLAEVLVVVLIVSGVLGVAALAWYTSERSLRLSAADVGSVVPPGAAAVLSVLRSSVIIVDDEDRVHKASAPAHALGLIRGNRLDSTDLAEVVRNVRRDGRIREVDVELASNGSAPRFLAARVAPLGSNLVLTLIEDRTRERRLAEMRNDFVANVSHELKTPVGAIRLLAEAVRDASADPEAVSRFSGRMLVESDRLSRLVQQLIELSRLQDDDPIESPKPVELDDVVGAAVDRHRIGADARKIPLVIQGDVGVVVPGNPEQIGTAISNLVANAIAYSEAAVAVTVEIRHQEDAVEISIADAGVGIPAAEIDRIFERFYRVDPARHRSTGGTGLGLSIVKHIAAIHGGDVRVWSQPGRGSTFTLVLPTRTTPGLTAMGEQ